MPACLLSTRPLLRPLLLLLLALQCSPVAAAAAAAGGRLNVLLLLVDDLRPALGCYGDSLAVTPSVDALAGQSVLFSAAYAQQALCAPSRTSLLTSRRPQTLRLFDTGSYWRSTAGNFTTLPQMFREQGYHTASMGKVFHPGVVSNHSDDQPYSWSEPPYHPPAQRFKNWPVCLGDDGELRANLFCPVDPRSQPMHTLPDLQTAERAVSWLRHRGGSGGDGGGTSDAPAEPWLLAVGLHKPHIPLKMPMEYLNLYPPSKVPLPMYPRRPDGLPEVAWNPWMDVRSRHDVAQLNISFPYGPMPEFFARTVRQGYYAAVSYVDDMLGRVLAALVDSGEVARTMVVLAGDHGWALGERGEWAKYSTSEDATRTPLLLHLPGETGTLEGFRRVSPMDAAILRQRRQSSRQLGQSSGLSVVESVAPSVVETGRRTGREAGLKAALVVDSPVELLDVMPTLAEAVLNITLPSCPAAGPQPLLCTEGRSLLPLVRRRLKRERTAAGRGRTTTLRWSDVLIRTRDRTEKEQQLRTNRLPGSAFTPTPSPCSSGLRASAILNTAFSQYPRPSVLPRANSDQPSQRDIRIMGYSVRVARYRYTEWIEYNPSAFEPRWSSLLARELYDHGTDPIEVANVAEKTECREMVQSLSRLLRTQGRADSGGGH